MRRGSLGSSSSTGGSIGTLLSSLDFGPPTMCSLVPESGAARLPRMSWALGAPPSPSNRWRTSSCLESSSPQNTSPLTTSRGQHCVAEGKSECSVSVTTVTSVPPSRIRAVSPSRSVQVAMKVGEGGSGEDDSDGGQIDGLNVCVKHVGGPQVGGGASEGRWVKRRVGCSRPPSVGGARFGSGSRLTCTGLIKASARSWPRGGVTMIFKRGLSWSWDGSSGLDEGLLAVAVGGA